MPRRFTKNDPKIHFDKKKCLRFTMITYIIVSHLFSSLFCRWLKIARIIYVLCRMERNRNIFNGSNNFMQLESCLCQYVQYPLHKTILDTFFATKRTLSMSSSTMSSICFVKPVKIWKMWKHTFRYLNLQFSSFICQAAFSFAKILSDIVLSFGHLSNLLSRHIELISKLTSHQ